MYARLGLSICLFKKSVFPLNLVNKRIRPITSQLKANKFDADSLTDIVKN